MKRVADWLHISKKKREKWKISSGSIRYNHFFYFSLFLLIWVFQPVSSQDGDGVIVTAADFQALQAFKQELTDPKGFLKSWNDSGYGACSGGWVGIKCTQGQVIVIQLPWKGFSGQITEKICQLQALRKLSLHDNLTGGSIPSTLGFLPNLRGVQLFNNRLSGSIPPSLGFSPILQTLDLSNNSLSGTIPPSIANSTKLFRINLSLILFSGSIPSSIISSPSIIFLSLDHNSLSGSLPASLGKLTKIQELSLNGNKFNGAIPNEIGRLCKLRKLDLSNNAINGSLPTSISNLSSLFKSSSFVGNIQLCGYNGSISCLCEVPSQGTTSPSPERLKSHRNKLSTKDIVLIAAGCLLLVLLILCCILLYCLLRRRSGSKAKAGQGTRRAGAVARTEKGVPALGGEAESGGEVGGKLVHFDGPMVFTADHLLCTTTEIMGKSTYGIVYKDTLEDGHEVALKRLRENITKGQTEFETEVNVLGQI
ncbi:hypothetical protein CsatB_010087 [Cannabis sativa]